MDLCVKEIMATVPGLVSAVVCSIIADNRTGTNRMSPKSTKNASI